MCDKCGGTGLACTRCVPGGCNSRITEDNQKQMSCDVAAEAVRKMDKCFWQVGKIILELQECGWSDMKDLPETAGKDNEFIFAFLDRKKCRDRKKDAVWCHLVDCQKCLENNAEALNGMVSYRIGSDVNKLERVLAWTMIKKYDVVKTDGCV